MIAETTHISRQERRRAGKKKMAIVRTVTQKGNKKVQIILPSASEHMRDPGWPAIRAEAERVYSWLTHRDWPFGLNPDDDFCPAALDRGCFLCEYFLKWSPEHPMGCECMHPCAEITRAYGPVFEPIPEVDPPKCTGCTCPDCPDVCENPDGCPDHPTCDAAGDAIVTTTH